jgi:hypothetical protein
LAAALPLFDDVGADVDQGGPGNARLLTHFFQQVQRNVQFTNDPERPRQATDFPIRLSSFAAVEALGEDRHGLAQAARGDARLVHTRVVACNRLGQMALQGAGAAFEQSDQVG